MEIATAINGYELDLRAERKSPKTIIWYLHKLRYFAQFLSDENGPRTIESVESEHIKAFIRYASTANEAMDGIHQLKDARLSSFTVRGYFVTTISCPD